MSGMESNQCTLVMGEVSERNIWRKYLKTFIWINCLENVLSNELQKNMQNFGHEDIT